jgi:uncharacterized phiE125 gp8 family phage protein
MPLLLVTPPAAEPVSRNEAKAHLRVDHSADDTLIDGLLVAAREAIEAETSRSLITTAWEWRQAAWPGAGAAIVLPRAPLAAVSAVTYQASGTQTLSSAAYLAEAPSGPHAGLGRLTLADGAAWPSIDARPDAVRVAFTAGYGATGAAVPQSLKAALLLLLGDLYGNREAQTVQVTLNANPTVNRLLAPFRIAPWETAP